MTSLLGTNHFHVDISSSHSASNFPVCRNPSIVYPPTDLTSRVQDGKLILEGFWAYGMSGEDACSPISFKVTFDGSETHIEAKRVDNFTGIEEPVLLKPSMINGVVASLAEHFSTEEDFTFEDSSRAQLDPKILRREVGFRVSDLVDARFDEPFAPCVPLVAETSVALSTRAFERTGL